MATAIFDGTGASAADWSAQDNWTGGSGTGGVPGSGDDVVVGNIPGDVTTNVNAFAAIDIKSFRVTQACTKRLGSATGSIEFLKIVPTNAGDPAVIYGGSGEYCKLSAVDVTNPDIGAANKPVLIYPVAGTFYMGPGKWFLVYASGGNIEMASTANVTSFFANGCDVRDQRNTSTGFTTFELQGGQGLIARDIATGSLGNGLLQLRGVAAVTTKMNVFSGGVYNHQSSGTVASVEIRPGGSFSPSGAIQNFGVTLASVWAGADFVSQEPGVTVTVSSTTYIGPYRPSGSSNAGSNTGGA